MSDPSEKQVTASQHKAPWQSAIHSVAESQPQGLLDFPPGSNINLKCDLSFFQLLRIQISNLLFNIVTLGAYRFWGRTRLRQTIWHSIEVAGVKLLYHGTGLELFVANLLAIIVFFIPIGTINIVQFVVPALSFLWWAAVISAFLMLYFLWFLGQFLRYRYWAEKTSWSGITGKINGHALVYVGIAFYQGFLVVFTLGLWWPNMQLRLSRYLVNSLSIGNYTCRWVEQRSELFNTWILSWGIGFFTFVAWGGFAFTWVTGADRFIISIFLFIALLGSIALPLSYIAYNAALIRCRTASFILEGLYIFTLVNWSNITLIWIKTTATSLFFLFILAIFFTLTFQIWNPHLSGLSDFILTWIGILLPPESTQPTFIQVKILTGAAIVLMTNITLSQAVSSLLNITCWAHLHQQAIVIEGNLDFSKLSNVEPGQYRSLGEGVALAIDIGGL